MSENESFKRMDKPMDVLSKRQWHYAGNVMYSFYKLPGVYIGSGPNELPDFENNIPRADSTTYVRLNNHLTVFNVEDETSYVNDKTLRKISKYSTSIIEHQSRLPVSIITTTLPKEKCLDSFELILSLKINPLIFSLIEYKDDVNKYLSSIRDKIKHNEIVSDVDAMNIVMAPRIYDDENPHEVLEEMCILLRDVRVSSMQYKYELILQMQCVIHKYAKTLKDIKRLEGVINIEEATKLTNNHENAFIQNIIAGSRYDGWEEGHENGLFEMALRIVDQYGIDEAVRISGFSVEELESRILSR